MSDEILTEDCGSCENQGTTVCQDCLSSFNEDTREWTTPTQFVPKKNDKKPCTKVQTLSDCRTPASYCRACKSDRDCCKRCFMPNPSAAPNMFERAEFVSGVSGKELYGCINCGNAGTVRCQDCVCTVGDEEFPSNWVQREQYPAGHYSVFHLLGVSPDEPFAIVGKPELIYRIREDLSIVVSNGENVDMKSFLSALGDSSKVIKNPHLVNYLGVVFDDPFEFRGQLYIVKSGYFGVHTYVDGSMVKKVIPSEVLLDMIENRHLIVTL